ncbi:hypothetical protein ACFLS7_04365 [Bacteroidota bacterium]
MKDQHQTNLQRPPTGRLISGGIIMTVGFLSPVLIPFVVSSGWPNGVITVISGLLAFGIPELFMIIAVAVMGKEGFIYVKSKFFGFLKRYGPPDEVSRVRYTIGLVLFILPITVGILLPYVENFLPILQSHKLWVVIPGDIMLFISLFVLGGHFWDKLRSLFIRNSRAMMVESDQRKRT